MEKNQKIEKIKNLLIDSLLAEKIKNAILNNLEKFSDEHLDKIIESLELEGAELGKLEIILKNFSKNQDENWKKLEEEQKNLPEKMILEELAKHIK